MSDERKVVNSRNAFLGGGADFVEYDEDLPEMRHVKIASGPRIATLEPLQVKGPAQWMAPPARISKARSESVTMEKEWSGNIPTLNWNVKPECLELVPLDFPLERTHREIFDADACTVSARISEVLQKLSIDANFCNETAKAKCKTEDFVSFRIRMYSGGDGGQPVIVEVQRRTGPVRSFMQTCRSILAAAEGKDVEVQKPMGPKSAPSVSSLKCLQGISSNFNPEADCSSALSTIVGLLHDKRIDTNVLGMENLCSLTDPLKTPLKTAELAAKAVVIGFGTFCVREEIYLVLQRSSEHVMDAEEGGMDFCERLRTLALKVFSLSLKLTAQVKCLDGPVKEQRWFQEILVPMLLAEINNAIDSPQRACIAICCINSLSSTSMKAEILIMKGDESIRSAQEVGNQRHALLAAEAGRCLASLGQ